MRNSLIFILVAAFLAGCSDEPAEKESKGAHPAEHTVEQSAEYAEAGLDAAGDEIEVVTETETGQTDKGEDSGAADEAASEASAPSAEAETASAGQAEGRDGEQIYTQFCAACHAQGVAGAPKLDATAEWRKRVDARGRDTLVQNALNGYNAMPSKGTCMDCSKAEIEATVEYMLEKAGV